MNATAPSRRTMLLATLASVSAAGAARTNPAGATPTSSGKGDHPMSDYVIAKDGTRIYYKDWGQGPTFVFSHGWPLTADAWEGQMLFLSQNGCRTIAHDRRGHGRSSQPSGGNDMDTYADDLAALLDALDVRDAILVGHSTGGGEIARYIGRYGTRRVKKAVLISTITPQLLKTANNPGGVPSEALDAIRNGSLSDRSQSYKDLANGPFFGANRPGSSVSQGVKDSFWLQGMMGGHKNLYECTRTWDRDYTEDLKRFTVPTMVIHGEDDQVVPVANARAAANLVPNATLKVYPGAPHGLPNTHAEQLSADLLAFLRA